MSKIELVNHEISGTMTYAEAAHPVNIVMAEFGTVIALAHDVHKLDPIATLSWVWHIDRFNFVVTMADARVWTQTIRPGDRMVWMTYDVTDEFSSHSMAAAQILRKQLIKVSVKCGAAHIELTWL